MDANGYPEDDELETIEKWPWDHPEGFRGLLDYVKTLWWAPEWGWRVQTETEQRGGGSAIREVAVDKLHISTGGWSGNESIIAALRANAMFWASCWEQSRRGGHYIFELSREPVAEGEGRVGP